MNTTPYPQDISGPSAGVRAGRKASVLATVLLWGQGLYYLVTGVWPLVSLETFEIVTGEKLDDWLVQTVGVLIFVVALVLLTAAWRRTRTLEVVLLAAGSALALTGVDVVFVSLEVIPPIYLVDAASEVPLILGWLWVLLSGRWS